MSQDYYQNREFQFTSESVSHGHPDKICDQISDAILDEYLHQDPYSRVAVETMATTNKVIIAGEVRGAESITKNIENIVRKTVKEIGYEQEGFHHEKLEVINLVHGQSPDIAQGVDAKSLEEEGAGDQGIMFGYACTESPNLMPAPIYYAHRILENIFLKDEFKHLGPDAKSQVTFNYKGNTPMDVDNVVLSIQHPEGANQAELKAQLLPSIVETLGHKPRELYFNPTGKFVIGGPDGDAGLTGRKIIVDTYGGAAPHGGGAFSGKDPTKVDRSAAYAARYVAKNIVAAKLADACTIQLSYAIGVAKPLSVYINMHGTGKVTEDAILNKVNSLIDLTPYGIRAHLDLHKPIYKKTAAYGHFGRNPLADGSFSWEKTDLVDELKGLL